MPGFRLGFIIVPKLLLPSFLNNKFLSDTNTSSLYQKSFALLLNDGSIEKHMNSCRKQLNSIQNIIIVPGIDYGFDNFIKLNFSRIEKKIFPKEYLV